MEEGVDARKTLDVFLVKQEHCLAGKKVLGEAIPGKNEAPEKKGPWT